MDPFTGMMIASIAAPIVSQLLFGGREDDAARRTAATQERLAGVQADEQVRATELAKFLQDLLMRGMANPKVPADWMDLEGVLGQFMPGISLDTIDWDAVAPDIMRQRMLGDLIGLTAPRIGSEAVGQSANLAAGNARYADQMAAEFGQNLANTIMFGKLINTSPGGPQSTAPTPVPLPGTGFGGPGSA